MLHCEQLCHWVTICYIHKIHCLIRYKKPCLFIACSLAGDVRTSNKPRPNPWATSIKKDSGTRVYIHSSHEKRKLVLCTCVTSLHHDQAQRGTFRSYGENLEWDHLKIGPQGFTLFLHTLRPTCIIAHLDCTRTPLKITWRRVKALDNFSWYLGTLRNVSWESTLYFISCVYLPVVYLLELSDIKRARKYLERFLQSRMPWLFFVINDEGVVTDICEYKLT